MQKTKFHFIEVRKRLGFDLSQQENKTYRGEFFKNTDSRNCTCRICCTCNA